MNSSMYYDTAKSSLKRRAFNKIKYSIKNHIAKSHKDAIKKSKEQSVNLMKDIQHSRYTHNKNNINRINSMLNRY